MSDDYQKYDDALARLPAHLQSKCHLTRSTFVHDGTVKFFADNGDAIAAVTGEGQVILRGQEEEVPPAKAAPSVRYATAGKAFGGIDPEKLGEGLGAIISDVVSGLKEDMEKRLAKIDAAIDTVLVMADRLDQMEAKSLRYRGYWRKGDACERNDAVTENGHLWIAVRATTDRPSAGSLDWHQAINGGRQ